MTQILCSRGVTDGHIQNFRARLAAGQLPRLGMTIMTTFPPLRHGAIGPYNHGNSIMPSFPSFSEPLAVQIILYPHETLRHKSKPVQRVDAALRRMIAEMFDLMYEAKGIGLAANQVDLPLRFFVINPQGDPSEKDEEQVFINPVISSRKGLSESEEGCLSLPGLYGQVKRPEKVTVNAYDLSGKEFCGEVDGMLARVIQHETDHLDGVMFTDRLTETAKMSVRETLEEFEVNYQGSRERGDIPDDETIAARLADLEKRYA